MAEDNKEKGREWYDALNDKKVEVIKQMALLIINGNGGDAEGPVLELIKNSFTEEELVYMTTVYFGLELTKLLEEDKSFGTLIKLFNESQKAMNELKKQKP